MPPAASLLVSISNRKCGGILIGLLKFMSFLLFLAIVGRLAVFYAQIAMDDYFNKKEVEVPNFIGRHVDEVGRICPSLGLVMKEAGQRYDNNIPVNCVITQDPPPGTIVKINRAIEIVKSLGPMTVACPDVKGMEFRDVNLVLKKQGLYPGKRAYIYDANIPADQIITQSPLPGPDIPKGKYIDLLVSMGKPKTSVIVPDFTGYRLEAVKIVIAKLGLTVGEIKYRSVPELKSGVVLDQEPKKGSPVMTTTPVNLVVNKGPVSLTEGQISGSNGTNNEGSKTDGSEEDTDDNSPAESEKVSEVVHFVVPPGNKWKEVRMISVDDAGTREIYNNSHPPGERLDVMVTGYGEVKVLIYLDGVFFAEKKISRGE